MIIKKSLSSLKILLADDDIDDRFFFEKALKDIPYPIKFTTVNDGEQLMEHLYKNLDGLPDIIFLDISMPRKTGIECLSEIRDNIDFEKILITMLSTSYSKDDSYENSIKSMLLKMGANEFIRKQSTIDQLKEVIENTITTNFQVFPINGKKRN
jgi:CheY-like chemotaxis protein